MRIQIKFKSLQAIVKEEDMHLDKVRMYFEGKGCQMILRETILNISNWMQIRNKIFNINDTS